jgi:hypothetical protein
MLLGRSVDVLAVNAGQSRIEFNLHGGGRLLGSEPYAYAARADPYHCDDVT